MTGVERRALLRAALLLPAAGGLGVCGPAQQTRHAARSRGLLAGAAPDYAGGATLSLTATPCAVDIGGPTVRTWSYDGVLPGREIRVRRGDMLTARLVNRLPAATTVHFHGLAVPNDMDGVPGITQPPVPPGATFTYRFRADTAGTYWLHPHVGDQLDRGLYAPLIVEDPAEPAPYDHDWVVVLDDWIDGAGPTPSQILAQLHHGMDMGGSSRNPGGMSGMHGMSGMGSMRDPGPASAVLMGATSPLLGGDAGDVKYPYYLVNGRTARAPRTFRARAGQRARIRFINAGADTTFRVALAGHPMLITHTDGHPVTPVTTDALLIGMGERYDVIVTLGDGVFPLTALAEGKHAAARALVRTGAGAVPPAAARPGELYGRLVRYDRLRPAAGTALTGGPPDEVHTLNLTGGMARYSWGINGKPYDPHTRVPIRYGDRVRIVFRNHTSMYHPMHIHGHVFQINGSGPRKDTVIVLPGQSVTCDFHAGNPGSWMTHCHNAYHAEAGMMTVLGYRM